MHFVSLHNASGLSALHHRRNGTLKSVGSFYVQLSSLGKRKSEANSEAVLGTIVFDWVALAGQPFVEANLGFKHLAWENERFQSFQT